jgi:hypothetical protein
MSKPPKEISSPQFCLALIEIIEAVHSKLSVRVIEECRHVIFKLNSSPTKLVKEIAYAAT